MLVGRKTGVLRLFLRIRLIRELRSNNSRFLLGGWWLNRLPEQLSFLARLRIVDDLFIVSQFECWVGILGVKLSSRMGEDVIKSASRELRVRLRNLA